MMVSVVSYEEEWRTDTRRYQRHTGASYGRVCLWTKLVCGHFVQLMRTLAKDGTFKPPKRARCNQCKLQQSEEPA